MTSDVVGSLLSETGAANCAWGDYDNDGYLDLYMSHIAVPLGVNPGIRNFLYHNNGDGSFSRVLTGSLVNEVAGLAGCVWGDYDNDGFLDLFVSRGNHISENNALFRNNGNSNGWIKIKLIGTASNRSAIGAKVRVQATIRSRTFWQMREINTGSGFCGGLLEAHFGLGDATNIDQVRIEWPSGIVQTLTNVAPRQMFTVVESQGYCGPAPAFGASAVRTNGLQLSITEPAAGAVYALEASTDLVKWTKLMARTSKGGTFAYTNTSTQSYAQRFYRIVVP
ncbi:MAG: CRTAC1 family protein, partial [Limisphaerales bacterium]